MGVEAIGLRAPRGEELQEVVNRAANGYERWLEQVAQTGYCARPVRLIGHLEQPDKATGELRQNYTTETEPDQVLLIACGNRRESRCPSCAARYRGDAFQLVAAGLRGGKGVPESVSEHPMLFVTFTAPSFGAVHGHRSSGSVVHPCRPRRAGKCPHGIPRACWERHDEDDDRVGQALCQKCFDYEGQILWNALAPELWRRTTIYIRRALARQVKMALRELEQTVRLSYVKVAEYQRRGALHFHAVLRLDGACADPSHVLSPPEGFTAGVLEAAVREAAARVFAPLPGADDEEAQLVARWGAQLDVRPMSGSGSAFTPQAAAAYIAKYATKSSDDLGIGELGALEARADGDRHLVALVRAAQRLGERLSLGKLRLDECAHALGFKGQWSTKSRRYSTTFARLRCARRDHVREQRRKRRVTLDACEPVEGDRETRGHWRYVGSGFRNHGEAWLALCAAARAREHRRLAREELDLKSSTKK